jgi:hypothetical protein
MRGRHPPALFVYGTLQFEAVLRALFGRVPALEPARLADHAVVGLVGRNYPGLVAARGGAVGGWVGDDLGAGEWETLDRWEDACYELATVTVTTGGVGGRVLSCGTYRLAAGRGGSGEWSAAAFASTELTGYAEATARWRSSLRPLAP